MIYMYMKWYSFCKLLCQNVIYLFFTWIMVHCFAHVLSQWWTTSCICHINSLWQTFLQNSLHWLGSFQKDFTVRHSVIDQICRQSLFALWVVSRNFSIHFSENQVNIINKKCCYKPFWSDSYYDMMKRWKRHRHIKNPARMSQHEMGKSYTKVWYSIDYSNCLCMRIYLEFLQATSILIGACLWKLDAVCVYSLLNDVLDGSRRSRDTSSPIHAALPGCGLCCVFFLM